MNDEVDPPQILEVEWDREQADRLFEEVEAVAEIQHVQVRSAVSESTVTLQEARRQLHSGDARAIQIYYLFNGQEWCDTLMVGPTSIRVVRVVEE